MCARKVQRVSSYILDCELFVGLQFLKIGVLVCNEGAAARYNVVDVLGLNPGENMTTRKQLMYVFWVSILCCRYVS